MYFTHLQHSNARHSLICGYCALLSDIIPHLPAHFEYKQNIFSCFCKTCVSKHFSLVIRF